MAACGAFNASAADTSTAAASPSVGGLTTITTWNKNIVQEVTRSGRHQLVGTRRQHLDGTWDSDVTFVTAFYLPPTSYVQPADTGVVARTTSVVRDAASDMVTQRTFADSTTESYAYNSFNEMTQFTDRNGHIQKWGYDTAGNLLKHIVAFGTAIQADEDWTYNAKGQVTSYTDFNGNVTSYQYFPAGASQYELQKVILPDDMAHGQPAGEIDFTYDGFGRVKTVTDPAGRTTTFGYDAAGRHVLTTYADTSTEVTNYGTGANSARVVNTLDRNGNSTNFTYDGDGRLIQTDVVDAGTMATLTTTTRSYDPTTGLLTLTDTDGDSTEFEYDYQNRIVKSTIHPTASLALDTQSIYNRYRLMQTLDYYGRATTITDDLLDRPLTTVVELCAGGATITTHASYYANGQVQTRTDGNGNITSYLYDERDRATTTTVATGTAVQASSTLYYDNNSNVVKRTDERGNDWVNTYTCRDRVLTSADPLTNTTSYTYTADTLVATVTNANGHTTTNAYSMCCPRLSSVTDPDMNVKSFLYDFNGNRTQITDESSRVVTFEYDGLNRQTKMTVDPTMGGLNLVTATAYDPTPGTIGQTTTVTNPAGQVVTTAVDGIGRTATITGDTAPVTYTYDTIVAAGPDAGLVETDVVTDPGMGHLNLSRAQPDRRRGRTCTTLDGFSNATTFTFDDDGNMLTQTDRDGKVTTNTYDERDRIKTSQGDTGGIAATTTYVFGKTNNLLKVTDADGKVTRYTYDTANRRLTTTYAYGTMDARTWTVTYKPLGQVATLTKPNGIVITYSYEDRELLSSRVYTSGMTTLGTDTFTYHPNRLLATAHGGLYTTDIDRSTLNTSYDMANRLIQEQEKIDATAGYKTLSYQYTPDSLLSQTTYPNTTVAARTYNANRLLYQTKIGGTVQATFTYDAADRRSQRLYANNVQHELDPRRQRPRDRPQAFLRRRHDAGHVAGMELSLHQCRRSARPRRRDADVHRPRPSLSV